MLFRQSHCLFYKYLSDQSSIYIQVLFWLFTYISESILIHPTGRFNRKLPFF